MIKRIATLLSTSAFLAACTLTGNVSADTAAFAANVQKFNANFNSNVAAVASGAVLDAQALGKAACANASELHGLFGAAVAPLVIAGTVDPAVGAQEAAAFTAVQLGCTVVDALNPTAPAALANATAQVVAAIPQIQNALKQGAPDVAAIALAPVAVVAKAS